MAEEKEKRRRVERRPVTINVPVMKVPKPLQGFFDFIRGHGVVALAIGLFLGADLKTIVDSLVTNIVDPIIGVATGNLNLSSEAVCIKHNVASKCMASINYGDVISTIISFIIAAFVVYLIVKLLRLDKLDKVNQ